MGEAERILSGLGIRTPSDLAPLRELCFARGAYVRETPLAGAASRLIVSGARGVIVVDRSEPDPCERRFRTAHALGHFELHRAHRETWHCPARAGPHEVSADRFARELLLPETFVRPALEASQSPDLRQAHDLAARYRVPLRIAARRIADLARLACAAVFWEKGVIREVHASPLFEAQRYLIPLGPLSAYSSAYDVARGRDLPGGAREVDATAWFRVPPYLSGEKLREDSFRVPGTQGGVTLLTLPPGRLIRSGP